MNDFLESGFYISPLGYDNVDCFVIEIVKLGNKMSFYFKNTKNNIIMSEEGEEDFKNKDVCRFCEKKLNLIKLEVIVTWQVIIEIQPIANVILLLHRNKVFLYHLFFIILVIMIVICSSKN